jgi:transposase
MIQITPQMRILLAVEAVDFRRGIDGMAKLCRQVIRSDPFSGYVFVFVNRRRTSIKILSYDGQGFWLCQKRLSKGRFLWWPDRTDSGVSQLAAHDLQLLLWNGNPGNAHVAPMWKRIQPMEVRY